MADDIIILGATLAASAASMCGAMAALPGPPLRIVEAGGVALVVQSGGPYRLDPKGGDPAAALTALNAVQRRLEAACTSGPFLAADPARAACAAADLQPVLNDSAPALAAMLGEYGACHQWDVVLRWQPGPVLIARREEIAASLGGGGREALAAAVQAALARDRRNRGAALAASLSRMALAVREGAGGETEVSVTVMIGRGAEALLEHALGGLPETVTQGAEADLRGPMPPVRFAALRLDRTEPADIGAAWAALALPAEMDAAGLGRHWRQTASRLHPDRGSVSDAPITAAGHAFRLLRGLIPDAPCTLASLQKSAGLRLRVELTGVERARAMPRATVPAAAIAPPPAPGVELAA